MEGSGSEGDVTTQKGGEMQCEPPTPQNIAGYEDRERESGVKKRGQPVEIRKGGEGITPLEPPETNLALSTP